MKENIKLTFLIISVLLFIFGIITLIVVICINNFKNQCKKENGVLIKGTRETICLPKKELKGLMEEINEQTK